MTAQSKQIVLYIILSLFIVSIIADTILLLSHEQAYFSTLLFKLLTSIFP